MNHFLVSKHRESSSLIKLLTFCSSLYTLHEKIFTVVLKRIFKFSFLVKSSSVYLSNMAACNMYRSRDDAMSCAKKAVLLLWIICVIFVFSGFRVLWSPAGKGLTSWLLFVMPNCVFVTFPSGILGQVRFLIVSIPDLCRISYFHKNVITWFCSENE